MPEHLGQKPSKAKLFFAAFHDLDFVGGEAVKVINQTVNLRVGGGASVGERGLLPVCATTCWRCNVNICSTIGVTSWVVE